MSLINYHKLVSLGRERNISLAYSNKTINKYKNYSQLSRCLSQSRNYKNKK